MGRREPSEALELGWELDLTGTELQEDSILSRCKTNRSVTVNFLTAWSWHSPKRDASPSAFPV